MPLTYDEIDGSWGHLSEGWPYLRFDTEGQARRAFIACSKGRAVPYGSYVLVDLDLRVETQAQLENLRSYLAYADQVGRTTYDSLRAHYIATGQWNN